MVAVSLRMAFQQECHHLGRIFGQIETHHLFVEVARSLRRNADRIDAVRHQHAVHHEARRAFVAVEEELLQRAKQKERATAFERICNLLCQRACASSKNAIQFWRTRYRG